MSHLGFSLTSHILLAKYQMAYLRMFYLTFQISISNLNYKLLSIAARNPSEESEAIRPNTKLLSSHAEKGDGVQNLA